VFSQLTTATKCHCDNLTRIYFAVHIRRHNRHYKMEGSRTLTNGMVPGKMFVYQPLIQLPYVTPSIAVIFSTQVCTIFSIRSFNLSLQKNYCGFFEVNYWKCMDAFGAKLGMRHCQLEARDLTECMTNEKTVRFALTFFINIISVGTI
jgi:hypothetical protein